MICTTVALPADAQQQSRREKKKAAEKQFVLRDKRLAKKFEKIQEAVDAEKLVEAKKILDTINLEKIKPYPRALVHQTYAFLAGQSDDYATSIKHYQLAISEGALPPQRLLSIRFNLGQLYMHGRGVPRIPNQAIAWFRKAAQQNYGPAMYFLGLMQLRGWGMPVDRQKAKDWFEKAAAAGSAAAEQALEDLD